jgi:AraC family transcriptional regulator
MDQRIKAAITIIRRESHRNLAISDLARRVNLSPWHFGHLFAAETCSSPKQYMRRLKMNEAQKLLIESFLSVKEIAAELGFGDRSHFSRDFKRFCGQTPSEFRGSEERGSKKSHEIAKSATVE